MKPLDWVLLVLSILWFLFNIIRLWALLGSREVKYYGAKVTIGWAFFIPFAVWAFIAWRVGG